MTSQESSSGRFSFKWIAENRKNKEFLIENKR